MKQRKAIFLLLVVSGISLFAAQPQQPQAVPNEKLGTVDFPVSCAPSQQAAFNRGIALLHDFWYDRAEQQFQAIATADPSCAMAYWGEAMTIWHQICDRPNEASLQRGLELVGGGQGGGAGTQRE